jgi:nitroimidazol reductase NimA-like FMN-containing flavoprotein (pyridoxamine 5'-phosphate oxidase superfamily)
MALARETEMTAEEVEAFLSTQETGVLSLADGDEPYAVPVSYGYDADTETFYFRLVSTEGSEKRRFLVGEPRVRFVVYADENGETYRSVVAGGQLSEIDPTTLSVEQIEQYGEAKRPLFEIWGESRADLDIQLFELPATELTGRRTEIERE